MPYYEEPTPELEKLREELGYYPKPDDFVPNPDFPEGHAMHGQERCQAWNTKRGRQCLSLANVSRGNNFRGERFDKCSTHGGKSLRGSASPRIKHAQYSQFMPARLAAKYDLLEKDVDLMDLRSRAGLLETRILDVLEHLDDKGSFELFRKLQEQWDVYEKYMMLSRSAGRERQKEYSARAAEALNNVASLIKKGSDEGNNWREIRTNIEVIRRLADTEQRQMKTNEGAVLVDRVMLFATAMASIFRDSIMSIENIAIENRRSIIQNVETQVTTLLTMGEYDDTLINDELVGE